MILSDPARISRLKMKKESKIQKFPSSHFHEMLRNFQGLPDIILHFPGGCRWIFLASIIMLVLTAYTPTSFAAELKNENARQEGNCLVLTYDLDGREKDVQVHLTFTVEGRIYQASELHVEGDVGKVKTGAEKRISWNILKDFPRGLHGSVEWELTTTQDALKDPITGMQMLFIKGGCFQMGDTFGDGESDEKPVHEVCVSDFYMGQYEVTQGQWKAVMGNNPARFPNCGGNCPVENVSWTDVQEFIRRFNARNGKSYRLPTEAEWEYAARSGGKGEKWAGTSSELSLGNYAWYNKNSGRKTHPVGQKQPNGLGLYDMSGNVWEWCADRYGEKYYSQSPKNNPEGASFGSDRVPRGGSWYYHAPSARTSYRGRRSQTQKGSNLGFRLVLTQ